jgi:hypothetical protein
MALHRHYLEVAAKVARVIAAHGQAVAQSSLQPGCDEHPQPTHRNVVSARTKMEVGVQPVESISSISSLGCLAVEYM